MSSIHLRVVELERNRQFIAEKFSPETAPNHKRVVENAGIHADSAIDFGVDDGRRADDHAVLGQVPVLTTFCDDFCVLEVIAVECRQVFGIRDVARADFTFAVLDDGIDRNRIVLHELALDREHIKFLNACSRLADAVIHKHIEFQAAILADLYKSSGVQSLEKCHHRIRSLHPKFERHCSSGAFRIDFFCHDEFNRLSPPQNGAD